MLTTRDDEVHVSSSPWRSSVWRKSRVLKLVMLEQTEVYPVNAYVLACVEIQRIWRGVLLRRRVLAKYLYRNFKRLKHADDERVNAAYLRIHVPASQHDLAVCRQRVISRMQTVVLRAEYVRWLAYQKLRIYYIAATTIARAWLGHRYSTGKRRRVLKPFFLTREDAAAAKIQNVWKSYINAQIFQFYVDLIKFREQTDARLMLKCINPKEASLIDTASGIHVRFRLGGQTFPPTIYYKLFLHAPVCDLGALAPRDYTQQKSAAPRMLFNNTQPQDFPEDMDGWYRRIENNDWRPISEKDLREIDHHAIKMMEAKRGFAEDSPFHYSKVKRDEDKVKKTKQKRRKWLVSLYSEAVAKPEFQRQRTEPAPVEELNDEELQTHVKALVEWTQELDFDSYHLDWLRLATAAGN